MILNVFGCIVRSNRRTSHWRCTVRSTRRLVNVYERGLLVSKHSRPIICCQKDFCSFDNRSGNYLLAASSYISSHCLTPRVPVRPYLSLNGDKFNGSLRPFHGGQESSKQTGRESCDSVTKKKSLFQNFKQMYRDYWYVLVPVHVVTSVIWFGGFYYLVKSGVDVVSLIEKLGLSERLAGHLRDSKAGYLAMSFALYKLATPLRYMVTIGGTTVTIKCLRDFGYIKPLPPHNLKDIYNEQRKCMKEKRRKKKELKEKGDEASKNR